MRREGGRPDVIALHETGVQYGGLERLKLEGYREWHKGRDIIRIGTRRRTCRKGEAPGQGGGMALLISDDLPELEY